jgi:hypothetical protein
MNESAAAAKAPENLPLFYTRPVPLHAVAHAKAGLRASPSYGFARGTNAIVLAGSELGLAARHYPIAFPIAAPVVPFAVVGVRDNENLFVGADGQWQPDTYIPAYVRRYPFAAFEEPGTNRLILCIDEGADTFEQESTHPFFVDGTPAPATQEAVRFCESYHAQYMDTVKFGEWLTEANLLEDRVARTELADGTVLTLRGFRLISPEKLDTLTDEQVLHLHKRGWLPILHFHLQSLSNWSVLGKLASSVKTRAA